MFRPASAPSASFLSSPPPLSAQERNPNGLSTSSPLNDTSSSNNNREILSLGMRVYAYVSKDNRVAATVRFVGTTQFAAGTWVGVELDSPIGKNNGSVQGVVYFSCRMNYGLFLREENVIPLTNTTELSNRLAALSRKNSANLSSPSIFVPRINSFSHINGQSPAPALLPRSPSSSSSSHNIHKQVQEQESVSSAPLATSPGALSVSTSTSAVEAVERRAKSASRLKLKLSQMMNFLNQQLEIVEELEKEERGSPSSAKAVSLRKEVKNLTEQELETIISFRNLWRDLV